MRFKIWSLSDYPGELTALHCPKSFIKGNFVKILKDANEVVVE